MAFMLADMQRFAVPKHTDHLSSEPLHGLPSLVLSILNLLCMHVLGNDDSRCFPRK